MTKKKIILRLSQKEAERLGVVWCECGHPINNHFEHDKRPCAHCKCVEYKQVVGLPRGVADSK